MKTTIILLLAAFATSGNLLAQDCKQTLPSVSYRTVNPGKPTVSRTVNPGRPTDTEPPINNSVKLSAEAQAILNKIAAQLKQKPECRVVINSHGAASKTEQQLSWDRTNNVVQYLVAKMGISSSRIIFQYGSEGDAELVDLMFTSDQGPTTAPMPFPSLHKN